MSACDRSGAGTGQTTERGNDGWDRPPRALLVEPRRDGMLLLGEGPAGGRVLLRPQGGDPAAITIGQDGRFALPTAAPTAPTLYRLELDRPAEPRPGETLVLLPGGQGAVLASGAASRALVAVQGLTTVDYDGADLIVAGAATPEARVDLALDGGRRATGRADASGRFVLAAGPIPTGLFRLTLSVEDGPGDELSLVLVDPGAGELEATPDGPGFTLVWPTPGGGGQQTWFRAEKD